MRSSAQPARAGPAASAARHRGAWDEGRAPPAADREYLIGRACRRLSRKVRDERYLEWAAELPVILHDPEIRFSLQRAVRMLAYALGTIRGASRAPARHRRRFARRIALNSTVLIFLPACLGLDVWNAVQAPGDWISYFFASLTFLGWAANLWLYLRRFRPAKDSC